MGRRLAWVDRGAGGIPTVVVALGFALGCTPPAPAPLPPCKLPAEVGVDRLIWTSPEAAAARVGGQRVHLTAHPPERLAKVFERFPIGGSGGVHWGEAHTVEQDERVRFLRASTQLEGEVARTVLDWVELPGGGTCRVAEGVGRVLPCEGGQRVEVELESTGACLPSIQPMGACPALPQHTTDTSLVAFSPEAGFGWLDAPINGERRGEQTRSYLRADLAAAVQRAASRAACLAGETGRPLVLGDMSLRDGGTPRLSTGALAHPAGSHRDGNDLDIAYPQTAFFPDNDFRPVCPHWRDGVDVAHCTGPPHRLDVRRTAVFIAELSTWPGLRCIGVDAQVAAVVRREQARLVEDGVLQPVPDRLCVEASDGGMGWFYNHHDHMHVSASPVATDL